MSLDTANLLARIVAFSHGGIRVLHTLRINNQESSCFMAPLLAPETGTDFHRQHIDCSALLRLPHPVAVEAFRRSQVVFFRRPFGPQAFFQCGQDLLGIVKIAVPNDGRILPRLIEDSGGSGIMQADGLFRRLLRTLVAPFGRAAVGGYLWVHVRNPERYGKAV